MNKNQALKIAKKIIRSPNQQKAVVAVITGQIQSSYAAEKQYKCPANSVSRSVKKVWDLYKFSHEVVSLSESCIKET